MALILKELVTIGKYSIYVTAVVMYILMITHVTAQDLTKHKWEHRVILILGNHDQSDLVQEQLNEFYEQSKKLLERKLLIYIVTPDSTIILDEFLQDRITISASDLWDQYHNPRDSLKICLIGLDGRVKFTKNQVVKSQEIFDLIDIMPMRRNELEQRK